MYFRYFVHDDSITTNEVYMQDGDMHSAGCCLVVYDTVTLYIMYVL